MAVVLALIIMVVILKGNDSSGFRDAGSWSNSANNSTFFDKKNP
jgi:hypothetical protein